MHTKASFVTEWAWQQNYMNTLYQEKIVKPSYYFNIWTILWSYLTGEKATMLICFINCMVAHSDHSKILIHKYSLVPHGSSKSNSNRHWMCVIHPTSWMKVAIDKVFLLSCQEFKYSLNFSWAN